MIDARFVPLELAAFPGGARPAGSRRASSAFHSKYAQTLDRLENELAKLKASDVTIQAGYRRDEIRNDGWPRSSAQPSHPAVVLSFRVAKTNEEFSFPCDTFTTFEHNLHAIAYTLEALRDVSRYGVTRGHEQYKGFAQLPAPPDTKRWTVDAAAAWMAERAGMSPGQILMHEDRWRDGYRIVARMFHPDSNPAASEEWQRLQDAKKLLDAHFAGGTAGSAS